MSLLNNFSLFYGVKHELLSNEETDETTIHQEIHQS